MNIGALLASALWLFSPLPQSTLPRDPTPPRNSFTVAAETFIDAAGAVNIKADDSQFGPQMQVLKSAKDNLTHMAEDDSEQEIVSAANDLVFDISTCRIQAKGGASTAQCESQIRDARLRTMQALNKHKSGDTWQNGPPS